jgi:alkylation response protein AidB-like acyl-CoA dehydrogenase
MKHTPRPAGGAFLLETADPRAITIPEDLSAEDQLIGRTAEEFLRGEVLPEVARIEAADHPLMHDLMRKVGELGLLGADVPEVYGGLGLKQTTAALIAEKLNPQQSFALTHEAHTVIGTLPLLYFGNHEQKSRYLPKLASGEWIASFALSEANSGSDALAMQARAELAPDGSHYLLNGVKMWITNTAFAQLFTVFAKVGVENGDGKTDRVTAFLVERGFPGVSFGREEHKLGMHGTSTRRLILENVRVPVENALEVGKGHYAAFCALNLGRFKLEAGAVGGLKATLAACATYAAQRKTFGRPIAEYGLIRHKLAEMAARTFALESMVYRIAGCLEGVFAPIVPDAPDASTHYHRAAEEYAVECNVVKVIGSETYSAMTDEAIQIHGGYGYTEEFPVARAWRDQRLLRIGEGANEIVRLAIVNTLLRRDRAGRLALLVAGERAVHDFQGALAAAPPASYEPRDWLAETAKELKRLALFLLARAVGRHGDALMEAQEAVAGLADVVCAAYAVESVWLRCEKLYDTASPRLATATLAAQVAGRDYAVEAATAARTALEALGTPNGDHVRPLLERLTYAPAHAPALSQLRRDLADRILEKEGYPLQ